MSRASKFVLWFVIAMGVFFVVTAVAVRLFIDPNDFRDEIEIANEDQRRLAVATDIAGCLDQQISIDAG